MPPPTNTHQVPALKELLGSAAWSPVQWMQEDCMAWLSHTQKMAHDTITEPPNLGVELGVGWRRTGRKLRKRIGMIKERQGISIMNIISITMFKSYVSSCSRVLEYPLHLNHSGSLSHLGSTPVKSPTPRRVQATPFHPMVPII